MKIVRMGSEVGVSSFNMGLRGLLLGKLAHGIIIKKMVLTSQVEEFYTRMFKLLTIINSLAVK